MRIHYRVQHAAGRDAALARLLQHLTPVVPEIVTDHEVNDANPMRNFLRCLSDPPSDATHLCVLQDDSIVCADFSNKLQVAVEEKPNDLISLFVGGLKQSQAVFHKAMLARQNWCEILPYTRIINVVGTVWPVELAREFVEWYPVTMHRIPSPLPHRSDDMVFGYWVRTSKPRRSVWATVPCLVEHPDDVPSVAQSNRTADGTDRGRRAIFFAG